VSSCSRACCDCEQNCSFGPPSIRRKWCSALLAHDRGLDRRWRLKGRPLWASPSADKSADPVMMPRLGALLCSAPRRTTARARCVHRSRRRTGAGQTVRVRVVRSESVGFPCTPPAVALSFVAPAGAAARQRRCRLFIPLFARLRMSWRDSDEDDEDDRVRTATAHDRCRRRTYPYAVGRGSDCSTQPRRAGCLR